MSIRLAIFYGINPKGKVMLDCRGRRIIGAMGIWNDKIILIVTDTDKKALAFTR